MKHCKTVRRGDEGANLINVACVLIMTHGGGKGKAGESPIAVVPQQRICFTCRLNVHMSTHERPSVNYSPQSAVVSQSYRIDLMALMPF